MEITIDVASVIRFFVSLVILATAILFILAHFVYWQMRAAVRDEIEHIAEESKGKL